MTNAEYFLRLFDTDGGVDSARAFFAEHAVGTHYGESAINRNHKQVLVFFQDKSFATMNHKVFVEFRGW